MTTENAAPSRVALPITTRMTLTLATTAFVVFGAYGAYLVRAERTRLRATVQHELRLLGRTLQLSMEDALRDRQLSDVRSTLSHLERVDPAVDILVFGPAGRLEAASTATQASRRSYDALAAEILETRETRLVTGDDLDPPRDMLGAPLVSDTGSMLGAIVVARPLADLHAAYLATIRGVAIGVALCVLATALMGVALGRAYIKRPLRLLAGAMRNVRGGDLETAIAVERQDEMGNVAAEFNAMLGELRSARRRLVEEQERRRQLRRDLQDVEKLATIGQLAAGLAHEIGSPLQVLQGRAHGLQGVAERPDEVRRIAGILVSQTERITRIIERLLAVARRRPRNVAPLDLADPVGLVVDLLEFEARRRDVSLTLKVAPGLRPVTADADAVQQVVLNLVRNALQATPDHGRVDVALDPATVRLPATGEDVPAVRLSVADSGAGVPPDDRERVFEAFYTTRAESGGTGLGLAVVRAIVEAHQGTISVRSEPGAGATFEVVLPERT
jgi:signal transduction histidine kinase